MRNLFLGIALIATLAGCASTTNVRPYVLDLERGLHKRYLPTADGGLVARDCYTSCAPILRGRVPDEDLIRVHEASRLGLQKYVPWKGKRYVPFPLMKVQDRGSEEMCVVTCAIEDKDSTFEIRFDESSYSLIEE